MKILRLCVFVAMLFFCKTLFAANPVKVQQFINHKDWSFVENKGQLQSNEIKYYGHQGGVYLYCKPGMLSFVFTKVEKEPNDVSEATGQLVETQCLRLPHAPAIPNLHQDAFNASLQPKISTSRMNLILIGSNPNAQIIATDQQAYYENYYTTGNADSGITNVHTFKTVTYKDIYPHIDMVLKSEGNPAKAMAGDGGMEYSFLVHPGGNVADIQLRWDGYDETKNLRNGRIKFGNALGSMEQSAPKSFAERNEVESRLI